MPPLTPAFFLTAARTLLAAQQTWLNLESKRHRDPVEAWLRDLHQPGDVMDTATFIAHIGYTSHQTARGYSSWPFPLSADCNDLAALARLKGVMRNDKPREGDILLEWSEIECRFVRASAVISAHQIATAPGSPDVFDCQIIEGSARLVTLTSRIGRNGTRTPTAFETEIQWVRRTRKWVCPDRGDRMIRWVDLDGHSSLSPGIKTKPAA